MCNSYLEAQTGKHLMSVCCADFFFLNSSLNNSVCMPCNDKLMKECMPYFKLCMFLEYSYLNWSAEHFDSKLG